MIDLIRASDAGLLLQRRELLQTEPPQAHSPLFCGGCPQCDQWRRWAQRLIQVNQEIQQRQQTLTDKKA